MAYIEIIPKTSVAEARLADDGMELPNLLAQATKAVLDVPDHDIIVEIRCCTTIAFNALAVAAGSNPDAVIKVATSDLHLKPRFETLAAAIVEVWNVHLGVDLRLEVWISAIDAWNSNMALA